MKDKAEMMRRIRQERRDAGLEPFHAWIKPEHKARIKAYINKLMEGKI